MPERVFIGLGSNLGDSPSLLRKAGRQIAGLPQTRCLQGSGFYRSPAWGGIEQPDYINAVLEIDTALQPSELLARLLAIEREHGRSRQGEQRWGPRVLDCDILSYGEHRLQSAELTVPHPRMAVRAFVLLPLAEIAPDLVLPGIGALSSLIQHLHDTNLVRLEQGFDHVCQ